MGKGPVAGFETGLGTTWRGSGCGAALGAGLEVFGAEAVSFEPVVKAPLPHPRTGRTTTSQSEVRAVATTR
jgi:hypothetical protein